MLDILSLKSAFSITFRRFAEVTYLIGDPMIAPATAPREKRAGVVVVIEDHFRPVRVLVAILAMIGARRAVSFKRRRQVATLAGDALARQIAAFRSLIMTGISPAPFSPVFALFFNIATGTAVYFGSLIHGVIIPRGAP